MFYALSGDIMVGGNGDDIYEVWSTNFTIREASNGGIDTLIACVWSPVILPDNVENLILTGPSATWGRGNALDNIVTAGTVGAFLDGAAGDDVLVGGQGADTFFIEAGNGWDSIESFVHNQDMVQLDEYGVTSFSQLMSLGAQVGADVVFTFANQEQLVLRNTLLGTLAVQDFRLTNGDHTPVSPDAFSALPVGSTLSQMMGPAQCYTGFGWYVLNNAWGAGALKYGTDYLLSSTYHASDLTGGTTFNWQFPTIPPGSPTKIFAYPEVIFGGAPYGGGYDSGDTASVFPILVGGIHALTATYDVSYHGNTDGFDVSFDIFTTSTPHGDGSTITNEVMIWLHQGNVAPFGTRVGTYVQGDFAATVYYDAASHYTAVIANNDLTAGKLDIAAIFQYLQSIGILSASEYLADIEFGAEVVSGSGSLTINNLDLDVQTIDGNGNVIDKVVTGSGTTTTVVGSDLTGTAGDDTLAGTTANQRIYGLDGNDLLNGALGIHAMYGGAGNDIYVVANSATQVIEAAGAGTDTVLASISYALTDNVERLTLTGAAAINGTGNALANIIVGNDAANILDGGAGADHLIGGLGDDTYIVDNAADKVFEAVGGGNDLVIASVSYRLTAGQEVETLQLAAATGDTALNLGGNAFANTLIGNAGANILNGGGGGDVLIGGAGNDTYVVDTAGDRVVEAAGGGTDTVVAMCDYTLAAGQEIETLRSHGGAFGLHLTGNEFNNTISGDAGNNILDGGAGNDILIGGKGVDTLIGGAGNDILIVTTDDIVTETTGGGVDTVQAMADFTLTAGQEIEYLQAYRASDTHAIHLTGNEFNNTIFGNAGHDVLDGAAGNDIIVGNGQDVLRGGAGDDILIVQTGDIVQEAVGGGNDSVLANTSYTLAAGQEIEHLQARYADATTALSLVGNEFNNGIIGNAGANFLDGGAGNDLLIGGAGADQLHGGQGADIFVFYEGDTGATDPTADTILDFSHTDGDKIDLSRIDANVLQAGDQAFTLVSSGDAHVAGGLWQVQMNGFVQVNLDTNGDGTADYILHVTGNAPLLATDFAL